MYLLLFHSALRLLITDARFCIDCLPLSIQFNTGAEERTGELNVEAGKSYDLEVRFSNFKQLNAMSPYVRISAAASAR